MNDNELTPEERALVARYRHARGPGRVVLYAFFPVTEGSLADADVDPQGLADAMADGAQRAVINKLANGVRAAHEDHQVSPAGVAELLPGSNKPADEAGS